MRKIILACWIVLFPYLNYSQNCHEHFYEYSFNSNRINAGFETPASLFHTRDLEGFLVPYSANRQLSTIVASSPWIGSLTDNQLKFAGETYFSSLNIDYASGPLGPQSSVYPTLCENFKYIWTVYREDIYKHQMDFMDDGVIQDTIRSVFGWPAQGNLFFRRFNTFELPENHRGGWAEFEDLNNNQLYEPQYGEYPIITVHGVNYVPDQIMWMVFNDQRPHQASSGDPLGVEIQLTAFAFNCLGNSILNNALFTSYKIINQNETVLDSVYFGLWSDYDIGCSEDDFMGSDSMRNTEYHYNDGYDGDDGIDCTTGSHTFGFYPPVQSMTYLSQPMNSFIYVKRKTHTAYEKYRLLTGRWNNGAPITATGNGNNPGMTTDQTKFLFHGNPLDSTEWSHHLVVPGGTDETTSLSSVFIGKLEAYESETVQSVYLFHQDSSLNSLQQVGDMFANVDELLNSIVNLDNLCMMSPVCVEGKCVWPGDFNHDGIANHVDLLNWGVSSSMKGPSRNGLISWRGHYGSAWDYSFPNGLNGGHADGDGNGLVDAVDLEVNKINFGLTTDQYVESHIYQAGEDLEMIVDPIQSDGYIETFIVRTKKDLSDISGLAYEIDFDTSLFQLNEFYNYWPDTNSLTFVSFKHGSEIIPYYTSYFPKATTDFRYASSLINNQGINLPAYTILQSSKGWGFNLKPGISYADIPDCVIFRLRNILALDPAGNDLLLGSMPLEVCKEGVTGIIIENENQIAVYPNPTDDILYIEAPHIIRGELINLQGQSLRSFMTNDEPLDVSGFAPGIYFLKFPQYGLIKKIVIE